MKLQQLIIILIIITIGCSLNRKEAINTYPTSRDYLNDTSLLDDYPIRLDKLSDKLSLNDSIFIDELVFTDTFFNRWDRIDSAYLYKSVDQTYYIEYYFTDKTLIFFVCKGYPRRVTKVNKLIKKHKKY
jgi:hypothetical protein